MSDRGVTTTPIFDELAREIGIEIAGTDEPAKEPAEAAEEVRKAG
ncbi:MAG TPA: hypothetical protein VH969_11730 [Actinophytocola sp.]|jgi:hypothetical protein